jgi:hypothetical protein
MSMLDLKHATGPTPIVNYDATGKLYRRGLRPWSCGNYRA